MQAYTPTQDVARSPENQYAHAAVVQAWVESQYERSILGLEQQFRLKPDDCPVLPRCGRYLDLSLDDWARARA